MENNHDIQIEGYEFGEPQEINLREYWDKLRRRKGTVITVAIAVLALGAFWTFIQKPQYTAKATLLIEKEPNILSFEQVLQIETLRDDFYQTQYRLLEGRALAEDVIRRIKLYEHEEFIGDPAKRKAPADPSDAIFMENLVDSFLGRLEVKPVRMTRLVQVNFRAGDAQLAANCVNELADAFIDQNIEMKFAATEQATSFISEQIKSLQTDIAEKERQLQDWEAKADVVALSDNETNVIDRLGELNKALTDAQIDRVKKEAIWNELRNMSADYIPEAINNPLIQRLREEYVRLKRDHQQMTERFQPSYPELQRLTVELESARNSLEEEIQNLVKGAYSDFQTALQQERSLEKVFNEQKTAAYQLNSDAILYSGLKLEIENKKEMLNSLLRRESETGVSARLKGLRTSNIRIVDRARAPVRPSSPNKKRNLILALLLGLGGGVGLAFLFDFLDNTVKTSEDVERYGGLPTLGVVPRFSLEGASRDYSRPRRLTAGGSDRRGRSARTVRAALPPRERKKKDRPRKEKRKGRFLELDTSAPNIEESAAEMERADSYESVSGDAEAPSPESVSTIADGAEMPEPAAAGLETAESLDSEPAVLGRIPDAAEAEPSQPLHIELVPHYFPYSRLAECYRSIRTALLLSSADNPAKTVAITSPLPGEGKTVSVANLAITLAQSEKRVLIVDSDLRKPRQHRIFKIKNTFGLTSYLADSTDLRKVIKTTDIPNLYLINSGPIPPNPAELLGSEKMANLIRMLNDKCDYMLFDMPPMMEISDALILGAKIDGIILVVQGDRTSREVLKKAREKLDMLKIRTLGVVINNVNFQRHSYYYKYYYRHYYDR